MREGMDLVLELIAIREGFLEEDRHGPADTVLGLIVGVRALESENADLRERVAQLSGAPSGRSSSVRPARGGRSSGRSSSVRPDGRPDGRPGSRASELLRSSDQDKASEGQDSESGSVLDLNAEAAHARANGRPSSDAWTNALDDCLDGRPDEHVDEDPDERANAALRAQMASVWDGIGGRQTSGSYRYRMGQLIPLLQKLAGEHGKEPIALWSEAVGRFKADPEARRKRLGLPVLCAQFERWIYDVEPKAPAPADPIPLARRLLT